MRLDPPEKEELLDMPKVKVSTKGKQAALALLVAVLAAVGAGISNAAPTRAQAETLTGAGSSFVSPLVAQWAPAYEAATGVKINYNPIGSGGGIAAITSRTVDYGASDAPLSPDQFTAAKGVVQIPWALSATSIAYNLNGVKGNLHVTGKVLADIYLGKVKKWNDAELTKLNKGVSLPDTNITPIYRSDNSGTSYNFTEYLSSVSSEWKSKVGKGVSVNFPTGVGGRGSSGVSGVLSRTEGGITYVDVAFSLKNKFKFFAVQNRAGKFAGPGIRGIRAAAATVDKVPADNELSIVNPPKSQKQAYPICTFTYVLLPLKTDKAPELRRFVFWALTAGQKFGPRLLFVPIPKPVLVAAEKTLKKVQT